MKPYKGIVRITCINKICKQKHKEPVADCINCEDAFIDIMDFEDKIISKKTRKKIESVKRRKKMEPENRRNGETEKK